MMRAPAFQSRTSDEEDIKLVMYDYVAHEDHQCQAP
jgi:hypothetical protein